MALVGREALVQRVVFTAISDVHLVTSDYEVLEETVGSVALATRCSTTVNAGGAAAVPIDARR